MTERSEPNNEYDPLPAIQAVVARIENGVEFRDENRYWLGEPYGGGYGEPFTLEDAIEEAIFATQDRAEVLAITTYGENVIAMFYQGRAFIPAEDAHATP